MIFFIFVFWLLPGLFAYLLARKKQMIDKRSYIAFHIYLHNTLLNMLCYLTTENSILNYLLPDFEYYLYFLCASSICTLLTYNLYKKIISKDGIPIYRFITFVCTLSLSLCYVYFLWLLGESGRLPFEVFLYNMQNPVNTEVANFNLQLFGLICFMLSLSLSLWFILYKTPIFRNIKYKLRKEFSIKQRRICIFLPLVSIVIMLWLPYYSFHLEDAYTYLYASNTFIEEHYIDPEDVTITWPDDSRNLIYIFMESFESSSFSKELGGMREINLLPNLTSMMDLGISFSDKKEGYGGGISMPQATVTLSGITAYLGGVNYKVPFGLEKNEYVNVIPQLTTLTDLLYEQGYQEHMIVGLSADRYSIGPFFRQHGNTITKGLDEVKQEGRLPMDYEVWWGFEDSKLFQFAKKDIQEIARTDQPFVYTLITNNTHRVNGYTEEFCEIKKEFEYPMENAIYCEDQMISEFLTWIMNQPFYENTTVVIVGDHLAHKEAYTDTLKPQEDRRIFNLILNAKKDDPVGIYQNRQFWSADMFPTVLSAMGVEIDGDRLGLGTDLFSNEKTLIEAYGRSVVSNQLAERSKFYTDTFLSMDE